MMNDPWEMQYMETAYEMALQSPDPSTQNGAVIIANEHGVGFGVNTFPRDVEITDARLERPLKYTFIEHAERNAIYDAARHGHPLQGSTMYVLWAACADCARAIIQAGITRVVTHSFYVNYDKADAGENRMNWTDSIDPAFVMFKEAGIKVDFVDAEIGMDLPILFNGEEVSF